MKTDVPHPIYLKDYAPPPYLIGETVLDLALAPEETRVRSRLSVSPNPASKAKAGVLKLDGEMLKLVRVAIGGNELDASRYRVTDKDLTIEGLPQKPFTLEIETVCNPEANKALSGLYRSQGVYCTQCEAEGFRRITYYLDRPDVLSKFRVRIEADAKEAPVLLSNGNLIESGDAGAGRHYALWEDPFPKPSYLFALVAGKLAMVQDSFHTRSQRKVDLTDLRRARQGGPLRLGHGIAQARDGMGRESLRPRIRPRHLHDRRRLRLQHGRDGEQGAQRFQRRADPGPP